MFGGFLLLVGLIGAPAPSGTAVGIITASAEATARVLRVQSQAATAPAMPLGAILIAQPIDPSEDVAVCVDFGSGDGAALPPLFEGETIAAILSLRLSLVAAGHGVTINQADGFAPFIDRSGRRRLEFVPLATDPEAPAFEGTGILCGAEALVLTSRGRRVTRTIMWRERQL